MLRGIRKASSNWLGKSVLAVVVAFLVVSFAIWGIGDIFRGFGRSTLAKVGGTEIGIEQFRQTYTERLQQIGRQVGRPITLDQARALGFDQQILGQLIAEITLDERARALRLGVSDAEIARRITADPSFQGPNGEFSKITFDQVLRQIGYNEQRYVAEQRRQMLRRQLGGTVTSGSVMPKAYLEAAHRYQSEERAIEYVLLDRAQAGDIAAPTPEVLAKYYDEHKAMFRSPEYRKIVIVSMLPTEQAMWMEISDADLKRAYEERKARFGTPERRQVQQIVFPNADDARTAAERIAKGATFEEIAKERGLTEKDYDLGMMTKSGIIDRATADAAFALKEGEVSAPVQGRFGTALLRATKIEPEVIKPFDQVAADLRKELAIEKAKNEMLSVYDKVEDERSLGKTLAEAAENLKLAARTIEVDRSGRDPAGMPVAGIPDTQRLLQSAFTTDPGVENDPLQVEGGYVWYDVTGITPARERTLDEVKDQVEARWRDDEVATRLKAKAAQLIEKLKAGTSFADVAAADKLKVESKIGIKRADAAPPLSPIAVDTIFRTPKDATASASAAQAGEQLVFRITDVKVPPYDPASEDAKRVEETLSRSYTDDIFAEYVARLENDIGVTINQAAVRQVVTGSSAEQ